MALPSTTVSRQAPRTRAESPQRKRVQFSALSVEDNGLEETEEPVPVEAVTKPPRLIVNGVAVRRLQVDFGSNATAFYPTGSVMERFWDQYDGDPDKDKYSRPRVFGNANISVDSTKGFLDVVVSWNDNPGITRLVMPTASLAFEPL